MIDAFGRVADRLLVRLAPRIDASAGCAYFYSFCFCSGGLRYAKKCMYGCIDAPNHCYPCAVVGAC
jgi:hypothetical protein